MKKQRGCRTLPVLQPRWERSRNILCHNTTSITNPLSALIKEGWTITDDPLLIEYQELRLYADLAAEKPVAAERAGQKIAVEIKVFSGPSLVTDLERAVGQYSIYRNLLEHIEPERELFLAIAQDVYQDFFLEKGVQRIVTAFSIHLLVFKPTTEEIVAWIS